MTDVVKNIYTFANILSASTTDCVKQWDQRSIRNALRWAKYCEKVEEETRKKCFRDDLDKQIQAMTILLKPVSLLYLSIDRLGNASAVLKISLLQNPDTSEEVLKELSETDVGALLDITQTRPKCLAPEDRLYQFVNEDITFMDQSEKYQAEYMMHRLTCLQKLNVSSQHRYDSFFRKVFTELQKYRNGWDVILYMFLTEVTSEENYDIVTSIKSRMLQVVTEIASGNYDCGLWKCEYSMLCNVSMCDTSFFDLYLEHLLCWAEDMEPVYGFFDNGDIYQWRHIDQKWSKIYSYTELQDHFLNIFQTKTLRRKIESKFIELSKQTFFNIYKDLLKILCS